MSYEQRAWGIIDNTGQFNKCSYIDFIEYCKTVIMNKSYMSYLIAKAMNFSFNNIPSRIGVSTTYIAMWNANDKENTLRKFKFYFIL